MRALRAQARSGFRLEVGKRFACNGGKPDVAGERPPALVAAGARLLPGGDGSRFARPGRQRVEYLPSSTRTRRAQRLGWKDASCIGSSYLLVSGPRPLARCGGHFVDVTLNPT